MQALNDHIARDGFRLRGTTMSRIDAFADVVFGFALTMLVVSLEVPKNFAELHSLLRGFVPFSLTFLMLMLIWHTHYKFFRRYGLHDLATIVLNSALLFVMLFFVYPLKFMFSAVFKAGVSIETYEQVREMTVLYAAGFFAIYALFTLMYMNALRRREALALTPFEAELTRTYAVIEGCNAGIGLLVLALAFVLPAPKSPLATLAFLLIVVSRNRVRQWQRRICARHSVERKQRTLDM